MSRATGRAAAAVVAAVLGWLALAGPASAAEPDKGDLTILVVLNAAGDDVVSISDDEAGTVELRARLAERVADHLGIPPQRRRIDAGYETLVHVDGKLAYIAGGRFEVPVDTGPLQVQAAENGYSALAFGVCAPKVRVEAHTVQSPFPAGIGPVLSPCRGWYLATDEAAVTGAITYLPDRERYPAAIGRAMLAAAVLGGGLAAGAWLLRRGPMRWRSWLSWLVVLGAGGAVAAGGWAVTTIALLVSGAAADPVLLGGGSAAEQALRTMLPGLLFAAAAAVPAAVLLSAPGKPAVAATMAGAGVGAAVEPVWWPRSWWPVWAAQQQASRRAGGGGHGPAG